MIKQITVHLKNIPGELNKFLKLLFQNKINVRAINVDDQGDYGLIILIVDKPDDCIELLKTKNYIVSVTDVIGVLLPDNPSSAQEIQRVAETLGENNVNIDYIYSTFYKKNSLILIRTNDYEKAKNVLKKKGHYLLEKPEI
jgi:hypothetical protein